MKSRKNRPSERDFDQLADFFSIFSDPARLKILSVLMEKEVCVKELADATGMNQSAVSHQLRVLKQSRIVRSRREGKNIYYSPDDSHIETIINFGIEHILEVQG